MEMKTALFWNSFARDLEWFKISAASYRKFASGWDVARCLVPHADVEAFRPACEQHGIEVLGGEEWPGKGFNWHQLQQCYADVQFPEAEVIFHMDSDAVFGRDCTPADWIPLGKILMPYTEYRDFLTRPVEPDDLMTFMGFTGKKLDFQRGQYNWKFAVDFALGFAAERECMAWQPIVHHREVYAKTRALIAARFPETGFDNYVFNARNEHPQSFCEFNTLGAVAHRFFEERYQWHNLNCGRHVFYGKVIQSWSGQKHLRMDAQLDRLHDYGPQVESPEINSPRKLFQHLGLL